MEINLDKFLMLYKKAYYDFRDCMNAFGPTDSMSVRSGTIYCTYAEVAKSLGLNCDEIESQFLKEYIEENHQERY